MDGSDMLIKDFIKKAMSEIESGIGSKYAVEGAVNFELSVGLARSTKGGFNLKVLELGSEKKNDAVHTVDFSIRSKEDDEFQVQQIIMAKLRAFLDQPNEKILQDLNELSKNSGKQKKISTQRLKLLEKPK